MTGLTGATMDRPSVAEEALLLASPNAWAAEYIVQRGTNTTPGGWDKISKDAEAALLERNDRFLDLRLAEYCRHPETARALFTRDRSDRAIRSLVLSNRLLSQSLLRGFPENLFGSEESLLAYLSSITTDEIWVLFANPTLNHNFIEQVLKLGEYWHAMPADVRYYAVGALSENTKLHHSIATADYDEGYDWYLAGKPFEAAWKLVVNLEVNHDSTNQLAILFARLARYCVNTGGILEAIPRWTATSDEEREKEAKDNERGRLSAYQRIRRAASAMLVDNHAFNQDDFLRSDDPMVRCGAYATGTFNAQQMTDALERDHWFAALSFIENPKCWQTREQQDVLLEGIGKAPEDSLSWEYRHHAQRIEAEHPEWFLGDMDSTPADRPVTESSLSEISQHVIYSPAFVALRSKVESTAKTQQMQLWLLIAVLVLVFIKG